MGTVNLKTASGGSVILSPANTAVDVTVTVPAGNATMATDVSTLAQFNASGSAPVYACRAWVNFNGTGTVAIRASGNVSSITDNGTGDYTVNFAVAMADANYSSVSSGNTNSNDGYVTLISQTTSVCRVLVRSASALGPDGLIMCVSIFR